MAASSTANTRQTTFRNYTTPGDAYLGALSEAAVVRHRCQLREGDLAGAGSIEGELELGPVSVDCVAAGGPAGVCLPRAVRGLALVPAEKSSDVDQKSSCQEMSSVPAGGLMVSLQAGSMMQRRPDCRQPIRIDAFMTLRGKRSTCSAPNRPSVRRATTTVRRVPPVLTVGEPQAKGRVSLELLGTTRRRDGRRRSPTPGTRSTSAPTRGITMCCATTSKACGTWLVAHPEGRPAPL